MATYLQQSKNPFITFGSSSTLKPTEAISLTSWVYRTSAARHTVWCNYYTAHPVYSGVILDILNDGTVYFWAGAGLDFNSGHIRGTTSTMSVGAWHHLAVVWEANEQARIYIDAIEASYTGLGNVLPEIVYNGATNTEVGVLRIGATNYWRSDMYLADFRVYDEPLSAALVQSMYYGQGWDTIVDGLVGRWPFDNIHTDISNSGLHGTLTNCSYVEAPLRTGGAHLIRRIKRSA